MSSLLNVTYAYPITNNVCEVTRINSPDITKTFKVLERFFLSKRTKINRKIKFHGVYYIYFTFLGSTIVISSTTILL